MLAASVVALCNGDDQGAAGATYVGLSHAQRSAAGEPSFVSVRVVFLLTALIVHWQFSYDRESCLEAFFVQEIECLLILTKQSIEFIETNR